MVISVLPAGMTAAGKKLYYFNDLCFPSQAVVSPCIRPPVFICIFFIIETAIRRPDFRNKPYCQENRPTIDWEWMLVAGLFLGAYTAVYPRLKERVLPLGSFGDKTVIDLVQANLMK